MLRLLVVDQNRQSFFCHHLSFIEPTTDRRWVPSVLDTNAAVYLMSSWAPSDWKPHDHYQLYTPDKMDEFCSVLDIDLVFTFFRTKITPGGKSGPLEGTMA